MTVHSAKGLEFDVVVVADTGREAGGRRTPDVLVDRRRAGGVRRCIRPDTAGSCPALGLRGAGGGEARAAAEEGRRLQYVAMTRARHHLIVSGGLGGNGGAAEAPIAQLCRTLDVGLEDEGPRRGRRPHVARRAGRSGRAPTEPAAAGRRTSCRCSGRLGRRAAGPAGAAGRRPDPPPVPCAACPTAAWRCTTAAGTGSTPSGCSACRSAGRAPRRGRGHGGVEIGDAVHLLLERDDERWRLRYPAATAAGRGAGARGWWRAGAARSWPRRVDALGGVSPGAAVRLRGGRRAVPRPVRPLSTAAPTAPRWWSTTRRTCWASADAGRELSSASYGHQVTIYALAALLAGADRRSRSPTPSSTGPTRCGRATVRRRRSAAGLEEELRGMGGGRSGGRVRARARARSAPTARRSTCCAPGRRWCARMSRTTRARAAPILDRLAAQHPGRPHRAGLDDAAGAAGGDHPLRAVHRRAREQVTPALFARCPTRGRLPGDAGRRSWRR